MGSSEKDFQNGTKNPKETPANYETAIHHAGQGKFQYGVMAAVGLFYISCAFETFCVSYLLPSAECDLQMTSRDKGFLNSSPFVGSLLGACVWGKLADSWGRRSVIITALVLDAIAALCSSFTQTFWPFLCFRLLTGFTNLAAIPVCYPYVGEMHSNKYRSRALCWMEMFWATGVVLVPLVAWGVIPRPWILGSYEIGFRYNSWRIFIAVCALPSIASALAVWYYPESPAFLLTKGRHDDALDVFRRIYHTNTGRPKNSYPIKRLEMTSYLEDGGEWGASEKSEKEKGIWSQLFAVLNQMADLFRPPLLKNTMIGICSLFSLQLGYFGFGMWFPELFNRFEEFSKAHPNETASVCEVANMELEPPEWMRQRNSTSGENDVPFECVEDTIQPQVFINTFSIGSACIVCAIITGLYVEKIGRKRVIVSAMTITACCGAGSYFVRSALQNLLLSCALQAFNAASFSTLMTVIIELFPATLRGLATTILMNISYVGSIVGNLLFGLLLDINCAIPVFFSAGVVANTPADYETAMQHAGQGKFQYGILFAVGLFNMACTYQTFGLSYLLPSAECDLQMTSQDKGFLNSSPFVGSLVGACLWGKLADTWGRRKVIMTALALDATAGLCSSLMQTFWPFLIFRFLTGFTSVASSPLSYPFVGEMHSYKYRSRALCWNEIFWSLGGITIPLIAWGVIPRPWILGSYETGFRYNSWRIFVAFCSIPSIACVFAVWCFPESPAFLLSKGRHDDALDVFRRIYHINTGRPKNSYPVKQLDMTASLEDGEERGEEDHAEKEEGFLAKIYGMLINMVDLFRPPLLKNTMIGLCSLFALQLGFCGFGMWFPELFNRFEEFSAAHPNETATLCEVANMEQEPQKWANIANLSMGETDCVGKTIKPQVFINTFSIPISSIICSILTGLVVERIGRNRVIVACMAITAACGAGCYFVRSSLQNLLVSCALQSFNSSSFSTLMSVIIELFPANLRGLATSILLNMSNVGSIVGTLLFGFLLDINCGLPIFISAGIMAGCTILCLFLPNTKNSSMS